MFKVGELLQSHDSFRNHSKMLIWLFTKQYFSMLKTVLLTVYL